MSMEGKIKMKSDYRQRDLILKGFFTDKEYVGGMKRFTKLPLELLELLVLEDHTPHDERHNNAPTLRDLITFSKQIKDKGYEVSFGGYAISPERDDYRTSVDTIYIKYYFDNNNHLNNKIITKFFENADEKDMSEGSMRFWYD